MLKLAVGMMIFILSSYIGFKYGETFRKRYSQLKEVLKALIILQNDILYGTVPLPEALENSASKLMQPLNSFTKTISTKLLRGELESVYDGAVFGYTSLENEFYLNEDDKKIMADFFKSLGESGVYGQEKIFSLAIEGIKLNLNDAKESARKNTKLYRYLGACIGGMIGIFIL